MTMRGRQRYSTQSYKKKELTGDDPYSMKQAPPGLLECPECHAIYFRKRWSVSKSPSSSLRSSSKRVGGVPKKSTKEVLPPQSFICPACRKLRDGYAEGFLTIHWPDWGTHKAEVLGLIHNEEKRASRNNPLERVMTIRTRPDGADLETTTEHFAQSLGKHLHKAFKGKISYQWSHKDKMARIEWEAPQKKNPIQTR
ncbi:MAG: BCAM0308 family protein [Nitrospirales bacterium]|nr:hypothetical protein [Nitrospirales bacterium]